MKKRRTFPTIRQVLRAGRASRGPPVGCQVSELRRLPRLLRGRVAWHSSDRFGGTVHGRANRAIWDPKVSLGVVRRH